MMIFDAVLVTVASWALSLGAGWAALLLVAAVVEVVTDGRVALTARLGCPAPVRRAVLAGLGVVLAGGGALAAGPVSAAPAPLDRGTALPVPARPTGAAYSLPRQRVEVQPGDSLWRISRQRSPSASTPDVARIVQRTYRANRHVIGGDPDLIQPGQRLLVPPQRRPPHEPPTTDHRSETP